MNSITRAEPTPPDWADLPVLNVTGKSRYAEVLRHAKTIKRAIENVVKLMVRKIKEPILKCANVICCFQYSERQCSFDLITLPHLPAQDFNSTVVGFTREMLDTMYWQDYMYAAHFRVMYT